jgi:hypothetical protein
MLMIQKMLGYVDSRPEINQQTGTEGNYMAANGLRCELLNVHIVPVVPSTTNHQEDVDIPGRYPWYIC